MKPSQRNLAAGVLPIAVYALAFTNATGSSHTQEPEGNYGVGIPDVFLPKYLAYRTQQLNSGAPDVLKINLGYVKGLSKSFISMVGEANVNLQSGAFSVSLSGLTPLETYTVWLVDRTESDDIPPLPDTVFGLVTFLAVGPTALLNGVLPLPNLPVGLTIDRVVVSSGLLWGSEPLGAGTVNVFQKIFFRRLSLLNESTNTVLFEELTSPPALSALVPDLASETDDMAWMGPILDRPHLGVPSLRLASFSPSPGRTSFPRLVRTASGKSSTGGSVKLDKLISQGAKLFFEETFNGNGRTCGTCHPANNNFTIDAAFIATLPANDPLFVAEFNPALAQLERRQLMRRFGLILENLDGFSTSDDEVRDARRAAHARPAGLAGTGRRARSAGTYRDDGLVRRWRAGDGLVARVRDRCGDAALHQDPARVEGNDFTLPKAHQLDALEAFQLSLGRSADVDLADITFTNASANTGKSLFINGGGNPNFGGTCNFCHTNGGANTGTSQNQNRNFNTNVEDRVHPARSVQNFPKDGGFGRANNGDGTFGNRTFNTASVVEAADTAPFFHNNVSTTLADAVDFYSGPEFNNPRAPAARFNFNMTQRNQIVNFLRGLNTLQNIAVARRELQEILANTADPLSEQASRLQTAFDETQDGIDVLTQSGIFTSAKNHLIDARNLISQAQLNTNASQRRLLIEQAIVKLAQAQDAVATIAP